MRFVGALWRRVQDRSVTNSPMMIDDLRPLRPPLATIHIYQYRLRPPVSPLAGRSDVQFNDEGNFLRFTSSL